MSKQRWGTEERKRALGVFRRVYPNWHISSNQKRCPECTREYPHRRFGLNFCRYHHFANEKWVLSEQGAPLMMGMRALNDEQLKKELKDEGLWPGAD